MIIIYILLSIYEILLIALLIGLLRLKVGKKYSSQKPFVSVIVAARNEEDSLPQLIESLKIQTHKNFEAIIVNDRSQDKTLNILQTAAESFNKLRFISVRPDENLEMAPKKNAINRGISVAKGEILLFTDADCVPQSDWIEKIVANFTPDVGLVAGYAATDGKNFGELLSQLDRLSLTCVAAGAIGLGFPMTCSAGNLAYRKSVFDEVGGFSKIAQFVSGDDDLFLHLVRDLTNWKITYCTGSNVSTHPPESFKTFWNQRIRHASKGKSYTWKTKIILGSVYLLNLWLFISPVLWILRWVDLRQIIIVLGTKAISEFLVILWGILIWKNYKLIGVFPIMELLHIPYVTILGLLGQFLKFEWKEQKFNDKVNQ